MEEQIKLRAKKKRKKRSTEDLTLPKTDEGLNKSNKVLVRSKSERTTPMKQATFIFSHGDGEGTNNGTHDCHSPNGVGSSARLGSARS